MADARFLAQTIRGRGDAMARLEELIADGGALALVGEGGIGKTRLARWAAERAAAGRRGAFEGTTVLGVAEPLAVVRDLVRTARRAAAEPPLRDPLAAEFPARLLPELGGGAEDGGLGATFEAAARYLDALAGPRGALIVLEDLHWADATSLSLVPFLARTLDRQRIALLLTFRPEDHTGTPALEGLRAELRRSRLAEEVRLGPLDERNAAAMLAEILGGTPAPDVTSELLRLAGGNPFAVEELARAAVESGWLDRTSGRRQGTSAVALPWTLAESIRARAAALPPAERELLAWAGAIGRRFDAHLLARASGRDIDAVIDGLDALTGAGLVAEIPDDPSGGAFAFRHALVHEALAREGLAARRRERHEAILLTAEAMADEGTPLLSAAELARHAMAAGDRDRTLAHSREAVAEAQELGAVDEAVEHLERALTLWAPEDGPALRAELLFACGRLRTRLARGDERAVELLGAALDAYGALEDEPATLWALALLADARFEAGDRLAAMADWEAAIPRLRSSGQPEALRTALVGYARGLALEDRLPAARVAADEGLALVPAAVTVAEAYERANLLITRGMVANGEFQPTVARPLLDEAIVLALAHHDDVGAARAHHLIAMSSLPFRPIPELLAHARTARELVNRHGLSNLAAWYVCIEGLLLGEAGDWEGAARALSEVEDLLEETEGAEWTRWINEQNRAELLLGLGRLDEVRRVAADLAAQRLAQTSRPLRREILVVAAEAAIVGGDHDDAVADAESAREELERAMATGETLDEYLALPVVVILIASGDAERADALARALGRQYPSGHARGAAGLVAMAADPEQGRAEIERAGAMLDALGRRVVAARLLVLGAIVASATREGRPTAALLARAALERFRAMGSEEWCRRLEAMLRSWGERAPTRAGRGEGGLSRRELEVLALVAEGLTNRGIAERLVISEHTAVRHVANLMAKLGAPSRAAAVKIAAERGLLGGEPSDIAMPRGVE